MKRYRIISPVVVSLLVFALTAAAQGTPMLQEQFIQTLSDHLEIMPPGDTWSLQDQTEMLVRLNFRPLDDYAPQNLLLYGQIAVILVRIYGLESELKPDFTPAEAITLLVERNILTETYPPTQPVSKADGTRLIEAIPYPMKPDYEPMMQEYFIHHLVERLEIMPKDVVWSLAEKLIALRELNFQPTLGYEIEKSLLFGQLAVVLVRVYAIENKLNEHYTEPQALELLVKEKILDEYHQPLVEVPLDLGAELINRIPLSPQYAQKTVLLPRYLREPVMSRCE